MIKMNKKGFTLIELLATIVILGIMTTVTVVAIVDYYKASEDNAEKAFIKQLEGYVEDYISLYGTKLNYNILSTNYKKCYQENNIEKCNPTILYTTTENDSLGDIIDSFANQDVYNPKTNIQCNNDNTKLTIYRDSDYVYCLVIKPDTTKGSSCLANIISTCENIYKESTTGNYKSFK